MTDSEVQRCIALLQSQSIRVCVFDMDLTAVAAHSHGCLLRSDLEEYLNKATPYLFGRLCPSCMPRV
jgi:hypothetical protein